MIRTGIADLPLHYGSCPRWLFDKMKRLGKEISEAIILEYGQEEFLKRLANPFFFQSFACVLGFDWHSSGVTTTVCGALKEAINKENLGIAIAGGKGKASRKVLNEIDNLEGVFALSTKEIKNLKYASRMAAKVDSACIQAGYVLYHHSFIISEKGTWCIIQQGMNTENRYARRYHWLSGFESFVNEPHSAICCDRKENMVLNMVAKESKESREASVELIKDNIGKRLMKQSTLNDFLSEMKRLKMPYHHDIRLSKQTIAALINAYEVQPQNYEELIAISGIGPKAIRALALISQLIYGKEPSWKDPVKFSFSHGGKDGIPYPVDRETYSSSIEILKQAVEEAKIGERDRINAIRRLSEFL